MARQVKLTAAQLAELAGDEAQNGVSDSLANAESDLQAAEQDSESDVLATLLELEGAGDVRWQIHRLMPAEDAGYVMDMGSAELSLAAIARKCGPGRYKIKGLRSNGRYAGARTITVAKPMQPELGGPVSQSSGGVQDLLAILREERARSKDEAFKWASLIVPTLAPLLGNLFQRGTSLAELTTALANMKALAGNEQSQLGKVEEFAKLIEVVKGIVGDGKSEAGATWVDLVRDGMQHVGPVLGALATRGAAPALPAPSGHVLPAAIPTGMILTHPQASQMVLGPSNSPAQEENSMLRLALWFKSHIPMLIKKAQKNSDPQLLADFLLDDLPAGSDPNTLHGILSRPDWFTFFAQYAPEVTPHQVWFTALRNELLTVIAESIEPETPPMSNTPVEVPHE